MEGQPAKRRRVYSLEPNKVAQSVFARNYVNYLVPALMKIKEKSSAQDRSRCDFKNVIKYEVDMAMAFSAQGFAWSNGLKVKLQRDHVNVASSTSFFENDQAGEGSPIIYDQNEMVPLNLSSNPSSKSQDENLVSKSNCKDMLDMKNDFAREDNEDEDTNSRLNSLRRLIPGGEEMCDEQMVPELDSYISCLQMQVNVLQCLLAETH